MGACAPVAAAGKLAVPMIAQPFDVQSLFAPAGAWTLPTTAEKIERERALNYFGSLAVEDLSVSGFVASRRPSADSADYRTYLGVRYARALADGIAVSGHTFYGAGTYSGDNSSVDPETGALPAEVHASGSSAGEWLGADWRVRSKVFERHTVQAGFAYRQPLALDLLQQEKLFGKPMLSSDAQMARKMDFVTQSEFALTRELSLRTVLRYDDRQKLQSKAVDPRIELRYQPLQDTTLSAVFDKKNAANSAAQIDATGFELGMERKLPDGVRANVSYAWQQTQTLAAGISQGSVARRLTKVGVGFPLWTRRLSTAVELQYHDIFSAALAGQSYDYVVGNLTLASGELARDTSLSIGMRDTFMARDAAAVSPLLPAPPLDGRSLRVDVKRKF